MAPILTVVFQNEVLQLERQINYNTNLSAIMTLRTSSTSWLPTEAMTSCEPRPTCNWSRYMVRCPLYHSHRWQWYGLKRHTFRHQRCWIIIKTLRVVRKKETSGHLTLSVIGEAMHRKGPKPHRTRSRRKRRRRWVWGRGQNSYKKLLLSHGLEKSVTAFWTGGQCTKQNGNL
jgi:hypothetical protein